MMPPFLGYPAQPDYDDEGPHESAIPRLMADLWTEGDDEDREWIDSCLETARKAMERDFKRDHHRMVYGHSLTVW
jgi:hypothetical protein